MTFVTPTWLKPSLIGAAGGAIALAIIGFSTGYVVTGSAAQEMAENSSEKAVLAALTPICVEQFKRLSAEAESTQLAALEDESSWNRGDFIEEHGWATFPGMEEPNGDVADACAGELMKIANKG